MSPQKFKILVLWLLAAVACAQDLGSSTLTTPLLIKQHGYPVEEHIVQTTDGYILTMHRIPYSSKLNNNSTKRPIAFLMHGIVCASSVWVVNGPDRALAYILSDAGYDVWMGNARGNEYSKKHVSLSPLTQKFWNFEWHQIGIYDLPAMIDYALKLTGEDQVRYISHSQGNTAFMVLNALNPTYKDRFRSAHLLAPIAYVKNARNPLFILAAHLLGQPNQFVELFGSAELLPSSLAMQLLGAAACRDGAVTQDICSNVFFLMFGWDSPFLNETMLPDITAITPAGSSVNQLVHYFQLYNSGQFRQFDYGVLRNLVVYGSINPPDYNLANLDVPTYIYHSDNDNVADTIDVNRLIDILNGTKTLKGTYRVPYPKWNHIDFLYGIDVENIVYNYVMNDIANS